MDQITIRISGDSKTFGRGISWAKGRHGAFDATRKLWVIDGPLPAITVDGRELVDGDAEYPEYLRRLYGATVVA